MVAVKQPGPKGAPEKPRKVTILAYAEDAEKKTLDPVVDQVAGALKKRGWEPSILPVHGDIRKLLSGLEKQKPDLLFNLLEQFNDDAKSDVASVGLLELTAVPHTGGGPGEFYLSGDKGLSKKLLAFEGISYPKFAVFSKDATMETGGGNLRMPLFVKPLRMDASIGIDAGGLVHDPRSLLERVTKIHEECGDDALAEEYIEGREFYVGVLGNTEPIAFPPIEIDFTGFPEDKPRILDAKAKWDARSPEYKGTKAVIADLPEELAAKLKKVSLDAYRALRVRDYGRVDMRLTETGEIYVLEVNASCYLEESSEFAMAAKAGGIEYDELVDRIARLALERQMK